MSSSNGFLSIWINKVIFIFFILELSSFSRVDFYVICISVIFWSVVGIVDVVFSDELWVVFLFNIFCIGIVGCDLCYGSDDD